LDTRQSGNSSGCDKSDKPVYIEEQSDEEDAKIMAISEQ